MSDVEVAHAAGQTVRVGGNGVYVGSFNPPHLGHVQAMREALEVFDVLHLFVRYNEGVDLVDWDTKRGWFERIDEELDGRLRIHKMVNEKVKGKSYTLDEFFDFMRDTERVIGEPVAGFVFGPDYKRLLPAFKREFPTMHFDIGARPIDPATGEEYSSTALRDDLEGHRDWLAPYVYESLRTREDEV